ncbi:MAG: hypothetical protein RLZZ602_757 [Pseudomonadota bacterium]|jgi:hypothetical protein
MSGIAPMACTSGRFLNYFRQAFRSGEGPTSMGIQAWAKPRQAPPFNLLVCAPVAVDLPHPAAILAGELPIY